jgi:hypothetical protein
VPHHVVSCQRPVETTRPKIDPLLVLWILVESSGAAAGVLAGLMLGGVGAASAVGGLSAGRGAEPGGAAAGRVGEQALDGGDDGGAAALAVEPVAG